MKSELQTALEDFRWTHRWPWPEVARYLGVPVSTLYGWRTGACAPDEFKRQAVLERLARGTKNQKETP